MVQIGTMLLFAAIPAIGMLRIDLASASFIIFNHQIWWSNFTLIFGLALVFATVPILTYMTIGTAWCGWACPQNLVSEWANSLTHKLLGKRASVEVDGDGLIVAASKNKFLNWTILALSFFGVSMLLGLIPLLYFFTPTEVWHILTFSNDEKFTKTIQMVYAFAVFLLFIDIAAVRYFLCDYACLYRIGHRIFKTPDALHIKYDSTRSGDCTKCNYCATSCITKIQPTNITVRDACINCGECVDACNRLHQKSDTTGLLTFELTAKKVNKTWYQSVRQLLSQTNWLVNAFFLAGIAMIVWGLASQPKAQPKVPLAVLLKERDVARVCSVQCEVQTGSCKKGSMEGCYRAAACRCECQLQQDPTNPAISDWHQCVANNLKRADLLKEKSAGLGSQVSESSRN